MSRFFSDDLPMLAHPYAFLRRFLDLL